METPFLVHSQTRIVLPHLSLGKGLGWGIAGGLAATAVMDLVLIGSFAAAGKPPFTCFVIVGDTLARLFSLRVTGAAGTIPLGMSAHYLIGPVLGGIFGAVLEKVNSLRWITRKQAVLFAVLYTEIVSQPLLALAPILLKMPASETLLWFGGSFVMHFLWGSILGVIVSRKLNHEKHETHEKCDGQAEH